MAGAEPVRCVRPLSVACPSNSSSSSSSSANELLTFPPLVRESPRVATTSLPSASEACVLSEDSEGRGRRGEASEGVERVEVVIGVERAGVAIA